MAGGGAMSAEIGAVLLPFAPIPAETTAGFVGFASLSEGSDGAASREWRPFVAGTSSESTVDLQD